jgi:hypothetical protein
MKLIIAIIVFITSATVSAKVDKKAIPICSLYYLSEVKAKAIANGNFDKYKHCAVSCMLALRCHSSDVLEIGILKELADVVGPGNAEMADLRADYKGVEIAVRKEATTDKKCIDVCHATYPENSCH